MNKIFHHVNLIGWDEILSNHNKYNESRSYYYCDTWSLLIIALFWGTVLKRFPGPQQWYSLQDKSGFLILSANTLLTNSFVLPFFNSNISMIKFAKSFSSTNTNLIIGISSPKQNLLSYFMVKYSNLPINCNIYCLGAAIYYAPKFFIPFFSFLFYSPLRAFLKMFLTFKYIFLAFRHPRLFSSYLNLFK